METEISGKKSSKNKKKSKAETDKLKARAKEKVSEIIKEASESLDSEEIQDEGLDDNFEVPKEDDVLSRIFGKRNDDEDVLNRVPPDLEMPTEPEDKPMIDVFEFSNAYCNKVGDVPKFKIEKDGMWLKEHIGPYSYSKLQNLHGGGRYRVWAYTNTGLNGRSTGGYIMSQTKLIHDQPTQNVPEKVEAEASENQSELVSLVRELISQKSKGSYEEARVQADAKATEMTLMMQMMNQQNQNMMQMIQASQKENNSRFEMMIQLMQHQNSQPKESLGISELLTLITSAKSDGAKEMKGFYTMAKELAAEMAEARGESEDREDESPINLLIKDGIPAIAAAIASRPPAPQQAMPQTFVQPRPQPQRPIQPKQTAPVGVMRSNKAQAPVQTAPLQTAPPQPPKLEEKPVSVKKLEIVGLDVEDSGGQENKEAENIPLKAGESYEVDKNAAKLDKPVEDAVIVDEFDQPKAQTAILGLARDFLIDGFIRGEKANVIAEKVFLKLKDGGFDADMILKAFPDEATILKVASKQGVPTPLLGKVKEFYANLSIVIKNESESIDLGELS